MRVLLILLLFVPFFSCRAQNIVSIYDGPLDIPDNPYFKDTYNDFNAVEGTWKVVISKGNELTIELKKMTKVPSEGYAYDDILIGAFKYVMNTRVLINELPLTPKSRLTQHSIYGGAIGDSSIAGAPICSECSQNAHYIALNFEDPAQPGIYGKLVLVKYVQNGSNKLRVRILKTYDENYTIGATSSPQSLTIPEGIYTLTKQ